MPAFAGEGKEMFLPAVRAAEAEEAGGEVATAEEIEDHGEDIGAERTHAGTVDHFVSGDDSAPGGSDDLPQGRGAGTAWMIDGGHEKCSCEHL